MGKRALRNKAAVWVTAVLDKAFTLLPMGLKGIHSDTGSEFINSRSISGAGAKKT
jgi:hypothetical protein